MKKFYMDPYVVCPFYSREESSVTRKIHCKGYEKGVYFHICFGTKELKKLHHKNYCKNKSAYYKCPLYIGITKQHQEDGDND